MCGRVPPGDFEDRMRFPHFPPLPVFLVLLAGLLPFPSCGKNGPDLVKIKGKTVYLDMAIEETAVRALRWEKGQWTESAATRSGYHGSFVLRVPPGRYRLEAKGEIPQGPGTIVLEGHAELPDIPSAAGPVDRILIELAPVPDVRTEG